MYVNAILVSMDYRLCFSKITKYPKSNLLHSFKVICRHATYFHPQTYLFEE